MRKQNKSGHAQIAAYDKIIKENLTALLPRLLHLFNIDIQSSADIKENMQRTKERKPDLLQRIIDTLGNIFILHVEFQVAEEKKKMVYRMIEYCIMLMGRYEMEVVQYVIYLGEDEPNPVTEIKRKNLWFKYNFVWIKNIDFEFFLNSDNPDDIIFAILGNFKDQSDEVVAEKIIERLNEKKTSELGFEKSIEQLRMLSNLRKLQPKIDTIMEKISKYFVEENDYFYNKGRNLEKKIFVTNLIENVNFNFSNSDIASLASVSVEFVEQIRKELKEKKN